MNESVPLLTPESNPAAQRQRQIATLNDDKMNMPIRQSRSFHIELFLINAVQLALFYYMFIYESVPSESVNDEGLEASAVAENAKKLQKEKNSQFWNRIVVAVFYLILSLFSYFASSTIQHLNNPHNVSQLKNSYEQMRNSTVKMNFNIECYHNQTTGTGKSRKTRKIVTHKAEKDVEFSQCYDFSGFMKPDVQKQFKMPIILVDYAASYEFLQANEEGILDAMYQRFVDYNKRDKEQDHKKKFQFSSIEAKVEQAYLIEGDSSNLKYVIGTAGLCMLSWVVSVILEFMMIERYEVKIIKKIKLNENQTFYSQ